MKPSRKTPAASVPNSPPEADNRSPEQFLAFPSVRTNRTYGIKKLGQVPLQAYKRMLELIRLGAYDHVAASALGISPNTFTRWIRTGAYTTHGPMRKLYLDVMEARNQARALAEIEVKKIDPKFWLTRGPGKHSVMLEEGADGQVEELVLPGWDDSQHVEVTQHGPPQLPASQGVSADASSHVTPLQEFARSLQLMEELGILHLSDAFRVAAASPVSPSEGTGPIEPPPAMPVSLPPAVASE